MSLFRHAWEQEEQRRGQVAKGENIELYIKQENVVGTS